MVLWFHNACLFLPASSQIERVFLIVILCHEQNFITPVFAMSNNDYIGNISSVARIVFCKVIWYEIHGHFRFSFRAPITDQFYQAVGSINRTMSILQKVVIRSRSIINAHKLIEINSFRTAYNIIIFQFAFIQFCVSSVSVTACYIEFNISTTYRVRIRKHGFHEYCSMLYSKS